MKKITLLVLFISLCFTELLAQYNSVLANGEWYTISTSKNGIYRLDYNDFSILGINKSQIKVQDIHIYGNGGGMLPYLNSDFRHDDLVENAIKIFDLNNNGLFESGDYILFYGQSPDSWDLDTLTGLYEHKKHLFSDEVIYFLSIRNDISGKRIQEKDISNNSTVTINYFNDFLSHEIESENLIKSGRKWFGERFDYSSSKSFAFSFPNLDKQSPITIKTVVAARSLIPSNLDVKVNQNLISSLTIPNIISAPSTEYAKLISSTSNFLSNSAEIDLQLSYNASDNGAILWLDYIEINARRKLVMSSDKLEFRNSDYINDEIAQFEIENGANIIVWDVTDPTNALELVTNYNSGIVSFNDSINVIREYVAFNSSSYMQVNLNGIIENQNLHNIASNTEYVIISHPKFLDQAYRLANFHLQRSGLQSVVVTPEQIYNEFSTGMQDVTAIRDFLRMLYKRNGSQLKYVLLFGDGSYDPKDRIQNNTNYIPTYQSVNSTHPTLTYVTDDYFGLLDDSEGLFINDLVDIGIGRFPVSTEIEANNLVDKIERYYDKNSFGSWRNDIVFVADDGDALDANIHMSQADSLSNIVANNYQDINISKIYLDNYVQESTPGGPRSQTTQNAINNKISKGAMLVNYTGHGGPLGWTQERILELNQINSWDNEYLPLFMTATCKFSCFDNPEKKSAGEYVLLNKDGGAIALFSTTRLVYSLPNYNLNTKFINVLFEKQNGVKPRLGDIFKQTKVLSGSGSNNRNFTLLGDPALHLAYPQLNIRTSIINDTLKALGEVNVEGYIVNDFDQVVEDFSGVIYATVLDKEIIRSTLGQQSCVPMPYRDQNNILYKGSASVENGFFSFSFIVPKDIAYNYGKGKVSYYAVSDDEDPIDANGSYTDCVIGGIAEEITYDYDGAEIKLFMNTRSFVDGGITNKNPVLLADVFDESGINTVGNGIGHDIVAFIDGDRSNPYILNEYYQSETDNYQEGFISFPFSDLDLGEHTITLKLWDVFNNSSESTINFLVTDNEFSLEQYVAYPNPFSNNTDFYFQHNKSNQSLDLKMNIYSINGVLVKEIEQQYFDPGYQIGPILWDGRDDYGNKLSGGIYIAQLNINSSDGDFITKSIRVILFPE